MIVTIDGPSGVGKSSTARELARRFGFEFLDTGAMYRAVALAAARRGLNDDDDAAVAELLAVIKIKSAPDRIYLDGEDVTGLIRTPEISERSSRLAAKPAVRQFLVALQQGIGAAGRDLITEGRDQGTVVFPRAECKFFLKADASERALRRHRELVARGDPTPLAEVMHAQQARDRRDAERQTAPMVPADDAVVLDTTHHGFEQVLEIMESVIRRCQTDSHRSSTKPLTGRSTSP